MCSRMNIHETCIGDTTTIASTRTNVFPFSILSKFATAAINGVLFRLVGLKLENHLMPPSLLKLKLPKKLEGTQKKGGRAEAMMALPPDKSI